MAPPHVVLFPFMSKGHTIPILHLARLLLLHGSSVTLFTTPANLPFISNSLSDTNTSILVLPFPENIHDSIPAGIESTDHLPSMSLFPVFASSTKQMKLHFENALQSLLPNVTFMVTDGFFSWSLDSANRFNIPRLVFYGMSSYAMAISRIVNADQLLMKAKTDDEEISLPDFPWIKITRDDFSPPFTDREPGGLYFDFVMEVIVATSKSYGIVVNSFYELEPNYSDYLNHKCEPRLLSWSVGPLCLAEPPTKRNPDENKNPPWIEWLDQKLEQGKPVLYIGFGTQAEITPQQVKEIMIGLEKSEVNFLWVVRNNNEKELNDFGDFEHKIKERGVVVREWVDQREILAHESVQGFLSHCGWNSVLESICAKVPILAWPMMAEQPLNARMVVEELKIGLRVKRSDGSVKGFAKAKDLEEVMRELMEGEKGEEARKKVKEVGEAAIKAIQEGGSSWSTLKGLINELHAQRCSM